MPAEVLLVSIVRALVEVALLSLLAQGVVGLLAGAARGSNPVYRLLSIISSPARRLVRGLCPRVILDRHVPWLTAAVLFWLWIALAYAKRLMCAAPGGGC
ncbi:hypothetical protein HCX48_00665 [Rhodocyclus tenuis]|uniref:YggT family protein n=2 Tax=Rhodocyclus TaxID=1064 RepID=A0A6L5JS79_RHOTE|nr:hypothetical protein [Rhodocyclus gracilis]MQY50235.1 hypothetical protein [Rhodocyclus gracilis]MRD71868.1 hypothetical protein [Rhodocyclus gracilis]NJA87738.1 hypothetical protein [Rhodocyclus gracilis]